MTEAALLKIANRNTPEGRQIGYLMLRIATAHADESPDPEAHMRRLEQRLHSALEARMPRRQANSPQPEPEPISLELAKARVELLKASL
jgi:hypothetical protein